MSAFPQFSDTELILLILAAIYLWECSCWVRGDAVCFTSGVGGYRLAPSFAPLQNERGRLVFTDPRPFAASFVLLRPWPVPITPTGLCHPRLQASPGG